ncbi:unnamed protein product [Oncorhynchus mykiss]|uniref:Tumor necrosis factor receptor superfamily member 5 n=1 Tax=Oncorhynchus mykiss TaxID=8022 RepID=A0A060YH43_ONCMY|nr:unnamed protein product [Oncorhynchus mykiss]
MDPQEVKGQTNVPGSNIPVCFSGSNQEQTQTQRWIVMIRSPPAIRLVTPETVWRPSSPLRTQRGWSTVRHFYIQRVKKWNSKATEHDIRRAVGDHLKHSAGNHVHRHCTEFTSTSCVPCVDSTFLDEPNGLIKCKVCTNCDPGLGLKVKQPCTPSSDTVCGTLEGFYCLDPTKDGCRAAQRHSSCKPGQYINHTDTVCSDCTGDTYSDGSLTSCQPHTQCKSLGLQELRPGTHWSNSECGPQSSRIYPGIIIGVVASVLIALVTIILRRIFEEKKSNNSDFFSSDSKCCRGIVRFRGNTKQCSTMKQKKVQHLAGVSFVNDSSSDRTHHYKCYLRYVQILYTVVNVIYIQLFLEVGFWHITVAK